MYSKSAWVGAFRLRAGRVPAGAAKSTAGTAPVAWGDDKAAAPLPALTTTGDDEAALLACEAGDEL